MYNVLNDTFNQTIQREGITVSTFIGHNEFQCFFRRLSDGTNQTDTMTMFYSKDTPVQAGTIIIVNGENFICLNCETIENTVYKKSAVRRCNGTISTQDTEVIGMPFYGTGISGAFPSSGGTSVKYMSMINGETEIITEDCELSRKLEINDRFNSWGRTWSIENIFYINGIVTIYAKVQADTDITFAYNIQFNDINASGYHIGDSVSLDAYPTINGHITDGYLTYTSNNTDVATIDENGNIEFIGSGSVSFLVEWLEHEISVTTTETTIEEAETAETVTLEVPRIGETYIGLSDDCAALIKRNNQVVHDIAFTATVTNCDFANRIRIDTNQATGTITIYVDDKDYNIVNKSFTLSVNVPEYGLTDEQVIVIRGFI